MIKIYKYGEVANSEIFARENIASGVEGVVSEIIARVKENGDKALFDYTKKFDGADLSSLKVSKEEILAAYDEVSEELIEIMKEASENIRAYHIKQLRTGYEIKNGTKVVRPVLFVVLVMLTVKVLLELFGV